MEISKIGRCYVQFHYLYLTADRVACVPLEFTEYKQLENLLFNSECKIRTLVETIPDGVWVHDQNLIITYCNEGLCRMLGRPRSDLTGSRILDLAVPGQEHDLRSAIEEVSKNETGRCEVDLVKGSGEPVAVRINSAGMTGTDGGLADYLAVVKDIGQEKQTSEALVVSERRYQAVVEDQRELICRFDGEGRLTFANQAYCRYLNLPPGEVLGSFFARKVPEEDLQGVAQLIQRVVDQDVPGTIEHRFVNEEGETRWLQWHAHLISRDHGETRCEIQAVGRDITERKVYYQEVLKYQEQLRSLVADLALAEERERRRIAVELHNHLGRTLEDLSTQLDKALAGRLGATEMAALKEARELATKAGEQCRVFSHEMSPHVQHEQGFATAVEWLVKDATERYGIVIEFNDDHEPKPVAGDVRVLLFQAVRDAVTELAETGRAKAIKINMAAAGGDLSLQLLGILDSKTDRQPIGNDRLRLFAVRERLGVVGGRVDIKEADRGTVSLRFTVPMGQADQSKMARRVRGLEDYGPGVPVSQMEVLLVDSQVMMREGMRSLVTRDELLKIVGETSDGRDAVDLAIQLQPDIALVDESTQGLGACETIKRIKTVLPVTRVIAMSVNRDDRVISAMLGAGAEGFIFKDNAHLDLIDAIRVTSDGSNYLSPEAVQIVLREYLELKEHHGGEKPTVLTPRELEVLEMLSSGMSTKGIARKLGLSIKTIETHRRRISTKLGLKSIAELTRYAIKEGLVNLGNA